ncbi:MAG: hypothetical protein O3A45_01830 [Proteobacteria bacterium]|nr:hypothetical protein [Pseudomonadota bacterium]MDA1238054.1 hypothetical protein [Pseudomonadota bacterium]
MVDTATANGATIRWRYANRMEHITFFILEVDSFEQIDLAFDAVIWFGHFEITPVIKK